MGDFAVKFRVRSKVYGFQWALVAVYGAAQPELKPDFFGRLSSCGSEQLPILVGGDPNIIRRREEKNNDNSDGRWSFMFNTIIESLDLHEIELSGRKFTWANALPNRRLRSWIESWLVSSGSRNSLMSQSRRLLVVFLTTRLYFSIRGRPPTWEIKMFSLSSLLGLREKASWIS